MRYSLLFVLCFLTVFSACDKPKPENIIRVGVTAGPHAMIMEKVKEILKPNGVDLEIIEFNDFILPNQALAEGEIDANSFQHAPYLAEQNNHLSSPLISIGKTVLMPLGIYSNHWKTLHSVPDGATVSIPNDPTNEGRALKLLAAQGLITLKSAIESPTLQDVENNPKSLKLVAIEAPQLPRTLDDVDISVINTDWILLAGLDPNTALARESIDSPYTNILVVRERDKDNPKIQSLLKAYHSPEVKAYIDQHFKGAVISAW